MQNRLNSSWSRWGRLVGCLVIASTLPLPAGSQAQDAANSAANSAATEPANAAGHSFHGESFNEGPRQAAYLMPGMAPIQFAITTDSPLGQKFFEQGMAQLHGFWYFEAERSFRQVAAIDPNCAMAYWGMAMANKENEKRARGFIKKGLERKAKASEREQAYLDLLAKYLSMHVKEPSEDKRTQEEKSLDYAHDLDALMLRFGDELEAKALLCYRLWQGEREQLPIPSRLAIDSLLDQIFASNPMHPSHHYRIHLWDGQKPERALASAARCGQSAPGIAHMWHMSGHTYSELKRFHDAVYQQEASARVDHAHMIRDRVLPDQIHNYAHNNEWLIRNFLAVGRVDDAMSLAKNMIRLPRHPTYNSLKKGSSRYGHERLMQTLTRYRLWEQCLALETSVWLNTEDEEKFTINKHRLMTIAAFASGQSAIGTSKLAESTSKLEPLQQELQRWKDEPPAPPDREAVTEEQKALREAFLHSRKTVAEKVAKLEQEMKPLQQCVAECQAHQLAANGDWTGALSELAKVENHDLGLEAEWLLAKGDLEPAMEKAKQFVAASPNEVLPLAVATYVGWQAKQETMAAEYFEQLRRLAYDADLSTPLLARLKPLAIAKGAGEDWRVRPDAKADVGERPALDLLGPLRWSPYQADDWVLEQSDGTLRSLKGYHGKPLVVVFYLGFGCLHCVEQLKAISPKLDAFREQGIEVVAVSTEKVSALRKGLEEFGQPLGIPLLSDAEHRIFRRYRCYDDFEQNPLHGTFFVAGDGRVLWQDIGYEPFTDIEFLLRETKRQMELESR